MAYVVILRLSPQHESNLAELLQSRSAIPVTQVTESIDVVANHVYVIPPSKYLVVMMDGSIKLAEVERSRGAHTSIDLFLRTLAEAYGKNAIGILLSGTGADATLGLGRIKEEGGIVIVQIRLKRSIRTCRAARLIPAWWISCCPSLRFRAGCLRSAMAAVVSKFPTA
jgi:two-component system, chemotaxis family, CheB/CheR fusion protein